MKNANGTGSIYKLSGKRRNPWIVRVTTGYDKETKEQSRITVGYYPSKAAAEKALADYRDDPYDIETGKKTFAEIYQMWYDDTFDENSNRSTKKNYSCAFKNCAPLHDKPFSDIRLTHIQGCLDGITNRSYETVHRAHTLINMMYKWALKHEIVKKNYAEYAETRVKTERKERVAFTTDEIKTICEKAENDRICQIVAMLLYSGVRISELLELKKEDVHLDEQWFYVRASKTNSGIRVVPIADKTLPYWRSFVTEYSQCDYAVCTNNGIRLTYENFKTRLWKDTMTELCMKHTPHETRHTFISQAVMAGCDQTMIKKIVGHKSVMNLTEAVYTHIETSRLIEEVNKIP